MTKKIRCPFNTCMFALGDTCFMDDLLSTDGECTENPEVKLCTLYIARNESTCQTTIPWDFFFGACEALGITEAFDAEGSEGLTEYDVARLDQLVESKIAYYIERVQTSQATFYLLSPKLLSEVEMRILHQALAFTCKYSPQAI